MKCADPVLCYTSPTGKKFYRHYSLASQLFIKHLHQQVFPCNKCLYCRKKNAFELATRCSLHASLYKQNCFLTLTYDEKKHGYKNELQYEHIQDFKKSLRRYCDYHFKKKIEIFNVHEYGKNGKKHWHLIVFNHDFSKDVLNKKTVSKKHLRDDIYISPKLDSLWTFGIHSIQEVTMASAMYQAQYTQKDIKNGNTNNLQKAKSNHSGIGRPYFLKHYKQLLNLGFIPVSNTRIGLPRYFQRLAHKHYSHFFERINFIDTDERKALYRPFWKTSGSYSRLVREWPNYDIALSFIEYRNNKQKHVEEISNEWFEYISKLDLDDTPDFVKSNKNALHDLNNNNQQERF